MGNVLFVYGVGMSILCLIYNIEREPKEDRVDERKKQTSKLFRESIEQSKINELIKSNVKVGKRMSVEHNIRKAGLDLSFEEFILISIASGFLFALLFGTLMKNIYLAILFVVIGVFVPAQVIGFMKNRRILKLEKQIGSFMQMTIKRYVNTKNMHTALKMTAKELEGTEPIVSEVKKTVISIELGIPIPEALKDLAIRSDNKYMERFASYYEIASEAGTRDLRENLLMEAFNQFEEDRQLKRALKDKIAEPVNHAKLLIASVPAVALYNIITSDGYITFMTTTKIGKIGTTLIVATLVVVSWVVNKKIGAPLD